MTKANQADKAIKAQIRAFTGLVEKNEATTILSHSSENFKRKSQFCFSVPKICGGGGLQF